MKQLFVEISQGNFIELDLKEDIPFPIDKSIYDFKDINKKKQEISKTVRLPGTKNNNRFFKPFIEYGSIQSDSEDTYNVDREVVAKVLSNSIEILQGSMEFIEAIDEQGKREYEVRIFGGVVDIFERAKKVDVRELGWSEYTHNLNRPNIKNSWTNTDGYVYPLIERRERLADSIWRTQDLVPYVYLYEVTQKLMDFLGLDYEFPLLDETRFKKILFGFGGGDIISISQQALNDRKVEFDDLVFSTDTISFVAASLINLVNQTNPVIFDSKFLGAYQLNINKNIVTDELQQERDYGFKVVNSGTYQLDGEINFDYILNKGDGVNPNTLPTIVSIGDVELRVMVNGQIKQTQTFNIPFTTTQANDEDYNYLVNFVIDELVLELASNDEISIQVYCGRIKFQTNQDEEYLMNLKLETQAGDETTLELNSLAKQVTDGDPVLLSKFLPSMKGDEFLKNMINTFNLLYFEKDDKLTFITYNDFYNYTDREDWTDLIDRKKAIKTNALSSEIQKNIKNEWGKKDEQDAKFYEDRREEPYGDNVYENPNHLAKGDKSFKTTWSNIVPFENGDELIYPRFMSNGKPKKGVPRIMMYNGLKDGSFTLRNTEDTDNETLNEYPLVHTFDDIDNPTFDLNFSLPKEVYYLTDKVVQVNLFSEYFEKYIREITDSNARILEASFYLSEQKIKTLDFRKLYIIDNKLFKLNIVEGYDSDSTSSTKCELIKYIEPEIVIRNNITLVKIPLTEVFNPDVGEETIIGGDEQTTYGADQSVGIIDGGEKTNTQSIKIIG